MNIDFAFEREVTLKEMVFHTAAMATGNVGNPTEFRLYVSEDGETYTKAPVATVAGGGEANVAKLSRRLSRSTRRLLPTTSAWLWIACRLDVPERS
ncbi:MAG: hypothetical protein ACLUFV_09780 [Acutalibacteraceae bacterium]